MTTITLFRRPSSTWNCPTELDDAAVRQPRVPDEGVLAILLGSNESEGVVDLEGGTGGKMMLDRLLDVWSHFNDRIPIGDDQMLAAEAGEALHPFLEYAQEHRGHLDVGADEALVGIHKVMDDYRGAGILAREDLAMICFHAGVVIGNLSNAVPQDVPEWEACEDCMGSGGHRDEYGEGSCGACGGRGRLPVNEAAREVVREREERRQEAIYRQAEREYEDGYR